MKNQEIFVIGYVEDDCETHTFLKSISSDGYCCYTNDANEAFTFEKYVQAIDFLECIYPLLYQQLSVYKVTIQISYEGSIKNETNY